jgi:5-methylcytosine-specific restriction endonuclease McrA
MRVDKEPVLALNKQWMPLVVMTVAKALKIVTKNHARLIDHMTGQLYTWEEWVEYLSIPAFAELANPDEYIKTSHLWIQKPEVITLSRFAGFPNRGLPFSRRGVYERDNFECQYCGKHVKSSEMTLDHILPVSHGGKTQWDNCTLACLTCNHRKANRTPEQAKMPLRNKPYRPTKYDLILKGVTIKPA